MPIKTKEKRRKLLLKTVILGAASAALYTAVFTHSNTIVELFARGGFYAALPIATVFVFSFVHASFAGAFWSLMGVEAATKQATKRPTVSAPRPTQSRRPRLRISA